MLDFIDDVAAGAERLVAVRGLTPTHTAISPIASDPMRCTQAARVTPKRARLGDDALAFPHRQRLEGLVFQAQ